jgi:hypothetical protein
MTDKKISELPSLALADIVPGVDTIPIVNGGLTKQATVADIVNSAEDFRLRSDLAASGGSALLGFIQAGTGAVPRTMQDKERDIVSAKDFAAGDGSDDSAKFASAFASLPENGGVYLPAGSVFTVANLSCSTAGVRITGSGTLKLKASENTHVITLSAERCEIADGVIIDGNRAAHTPGATSRTDMIAVVLDANYCKVKGAYIKSVCRGAGIQVSGMFCEVDGNLFEDMGDSYVDSAASCDCVHVGVGSVALDVGSYAKITNNRFTNFTDYGCAVDGSYGVLIAGNEIAFTAAYPFNAACGIGGADGAQALVVGNSIYGGAKLDTGIQPSLTGVTAAGGWAMNDNTVRNCRFSDFVLSVAATAPHTMKNNRTDQSPYGITFNDQAYGSTVGHIIEGHTFGSHSTAPMSYDSQKPLQHYISGRATTIAQLNTPTRGSRLNSPDFKTTADWTINGGIAGGAFSTAGAQHFSNGNAWVISGDGVDAVRGLLEQAVHANGNLKTDTYYTLSVICELTGRTAGQLRVKMIGTGVDTAGVVCNTNTSGIARFQTFFQFASVPTDLKIWVIAEGTPNAGFESRVYSVDLKEGINT